MDTPAPQAEHGFRGVRFDPRFDIFEGKYNINRRLRYLGNYKSSVEAAYSVNVAVTHIDSGAVEPNTIPPEALTVEQMREIRDRVIQLLDPDRPPRQRKKRPSYLH